MSLHTNTQISSSCFIFLPFSLFSHLLTLIYIVKWGYHANFVKVL